MPIDANLIQDQPVPFRSAEEAWFWTSRHLVARRQGRRQAAEEIICRPCTSDQVLHCLDQLYRAKQIDLIHAKVLRYWGERGLVPDRRQGGDRNDYQQWRQALARLEEALRARGFVRGFLLDASAVEAQVQPRKLSAKATPMQNSRLTKCSTLDRNHDEANRDGSLIATRTAGVSRPRTIRPLPLAAISPPNPDQLRVTPSGVTLSFLVPQPVPSTLIEKEI